MMNLNKPTSFQLIHVKETLSTNSYLQNLCLSNKIEEFTTVVADFQNSGRGQRGNTWESEKDKNLLFSLVVFPTFLKANCQFLLSQIVSLAIKEELDQYVDDIAIKWPNDIYWRDKKICGILIENNLMGDHICQSIIGIGININQKKFFSSAPNPVSIWQITGKEYNLTHVLESIVDRIQKRYQSLAKGDEDSIQIDYQNSLYRRNGFHQYKDKNGEFTARIERVESSGKIILKDINDNERSYWFKEVSFLI